MDTKLEETCIKLNKQLDEMMIMMAKRFQIHLPAKLLSKEHSDSIIRRKRSNPATGGDFDITRPWSQLLEIKESSRSTIGPIRASIGSSRSMESAFSIPNASSLQTADELALNLVGDERCSEEFNNLKQNGSTMDYNVKFEEFKALLLNSYLTLNESYFVSRFINGLNDTLRPMVKMMCHAMVQQATKKARL